MMDNLTKILTVENKTEETINITDTLILGYKERTNSNIIIFLVVLLVVMIIVLSVLSSIIINSYLLTKEQREYQRYTEVGPKAVNETEPPSKTMTMSKFIVSAFCKFLELPKEKVKNSQPCRIA